MVNIYSFWSIFAADRSRLLRVKDAMLQKAMIVAHDRLVCKNVLHNLVAELDIHLFESQFGSPEKQRVSICTCTGH